MANVEHLSMVQGVISRLAGNGFTIKGWSLTVAAAILALAAKGSETGPAAGVALISLLPIGFFWWLDAYYLSLERGYRRLYDRALKGEAEPYEMTLAGVEVEPAHTVMLSRPAVMWFHGALMAASLLATVLIV